MRTVGSREDLFVVGADGTGLAQLTDDAARDRAPAWSPDGSRIAMYSNRGGEYEIWSIRPDGSGLEQVTRGTSLGLWFPVWAPDGMRLAANDGANAFLVDLRSGGAPQPLPRPAEKLSFAPTSWSANGRKLAGLVGTPESTSFEIATLLLETGAYERLGVAGSSPLFLRDGRLVFRDSQGLHLLDPVSRRVRQLIPTGAGGSILDLFTKTADDATLYYVREIAEGDLWLARLD
jgi:hypothetical protein